MRGIILASKMFHSIDHRWVTRLDQKNSSEENFLGWVWKGEKCSGKFCQLLRVVLKTRLSHFLSFSLSIPVFHSLSPLLSLFCSNLHPRSHALAALMHTLPKMRQSLQFLLIFKRSSCEGTKKLKPPTGQWPFPIFYLRLLILPSYGSLLGHYLKFILTWRLATTKAKAKLEEEGQILD